MTRCSQTYKMFAYDEGWSRRINEAIDSGLTAEAAIERVQQRTRMRMRQIDDPLLADRMHDLEDLSNRLLRIVSGQMGTAAQLGLQQDTILIARNLGPAELLEYDRRRLKGVVLEEGSLTAHVTIVARAMGVPVLGRVRDVRRPIAEGDMLLLDVGEANVFARPSAAMELDHRRGTHEDARLADVEQQHVALGDRPRTSRTRPSTGTPIARATIVTCAVSEPSSEHHALQPPLVVFEQLGGPEVARDQDRVLLQPELRRGAQLARDDAQQAVGQVLQVVHAVGEQRIVDLAHAQAGALLDALDRRFGGQAAVDRLVDPAAPALVIGEHLVGREHLVVLARRCRTRPRCVIRSICSRILSNAA